MSKIESEIIIIKYMKNNKIFLLENMYIIKRNFV